MAGGYVLALDEGSSTARSVVVDGTGTIVAEARAAVPWLRPRPGWVELDPVALWHLQEGTMRRALAEAGVAARDLAACAVTTHRETVLIWDRRSGVPVHNAIVWISAQTDGIVERWRAEGLDELFRERTGLRNDSYFSAAKLAWLLEQVPGVRARAEAGELACGTVDSWLLWNLTGGTVHRTDHSCASRTALFNLATVSWDEELCQTLGIPSSLLPHAVASDADFGTVEDEVLGAAVPIRAVLADQQASMYGQACFATGQAKNTFGTAGVLTMNSGERPVLADGLTSSVGWTARGETCFELEGVVFHSGQTLQWLRENLQLLADDENVETVAASVPDTGGVYLVPAFGGLCAPHWDRRARAAITGMTLDTTRPHVVRAALESLAHQTVDIIGALDGAGMPVTDLKVDGGAARNNFLCQILADLSGLRISRPRELERTALGVAFMAGTGVGLWNGRDDVQAAWTLDRVFDPQMDADSRHALRTGWGDAVRRTLSDRIPTAGLTN